jgi:hypothetical protein
MTITALLLCGEQTEGGDKEASSLKVTIMEASRQEIMVAGKLC